MHGNIFDIKRYAIHDGPGIRTTVFLKGCRLRCRWCHNPESQSMTPVSMRQVRKLNGREFPEDRTVGYVISVDDLMKEICKDYVFFEESGGGVTFSGGEPLMQASFVLECLKQCKARHIHTCIDTSGVFPGQLLEEICRYTDLFLYDVKTANAGKFSKFVGEGFGEVVLHLQQIAACGNRILIRIPVIPGVNDDNVSIEEIIGLLRGIPAVREVNLLPFHRTGADKYKRLGMNWEMGDQASLTDRDLIGIKKQFEQAGFFMK